MDNFSAGEDPYVYPSTSILRNKLNLRDATALEFEEVRKTSTRLAELRARPLRGSFDSFHLRSIHRYIFKDLYDWAGELRTVDIEKGSYFARASFISPVLEELFVKLQAEKHLQGSDQDTTIYRLAYYLGEINAVHPFREGNGRTQREFVRELALQAGYTLRWATVTREAMLAASVENFQTARPDPFYHLLRNIIRPATPGELAVPYRQMNFRPRLI